MKALYALTVAAVAAAAQPALADRRIYAGREASAVKCAAYFSYVAFMGERLGVASSTSKQAGAEIGTYILVQHVSGTWREKVGAYNVMIDRLPEDASLFDDATRHLGWCRREFLPS
ncbi:MAG: hypothetical protein AAGA87_05590 [Pseudomonadota bacterium]